MSLGRYMKRVQIHRARNLLVEGRLTVGEVGAACGFASVFAFSRAFRRAVGVSPRAYRRQQAAADEAGPGQSLAR